MLRISQVKLPLGHSEEELRKKVQKVLGISGKELRSMQIRRRSLDARKKPELFYVYSLDVSVRDENRILNRKKGRKGTHVEKCKEKPYSFPQSGKEKLSHPPLIIGCGPAGLLCGLMLARQGYRPVILERGGPVEERTEAVQRFWETGILDPESNVQFGEGGAGTFSDGKLNTLIKDPSGRIRKVLETFVEYGAPEEILYEAKPHIGTDLLTGIVKKIRQEIENLGGQVRFHTKMEQLLIEQGAVYGARYCEQIVNKKESAGCLSAEVVVLAPGHSARDTFLGLWEQEVPMEAKSFAVGVRAEHPQSLIDQNQYGEYSGKRPGAASYKLAEQTESGRGVYSFCMCPGGYVVNASSEEGMLAVNGMSYHARDSQNANSAIVVTVTPDDYGSEHPLAGMEFQRTLEKNAYKAAGGKIPVQRLEDFIENRKTTEKLEPAFLPCTKGDWAVSNLREVLPEDISLSIIEGMEKFNARIPGFSSPEVWLSGVESRTSSPVRICREKNLESRIGGLYPCGEGAGYAGGITSAAVDGIKVAESIAAKYAPFDTPGMF